MVKKARIRSVSGLHPKILTYNISTRKSDNTLSKKKIMVPYILPKSFAFGKAKHKGVSAQKVDG